MASTSRGESGVAEPSSTHKEGEVEMSTLPSSTQPVVDQTLDEDTTAGAEQTQSQAQSLPQPPPPVAQPAAPSSSSNHPTRLTRAQSEALGPATEAPIHPPLPTPDRGPTLSITLMLTTGARHPYKIDEKYLRNRGVDVAEGNFDPREINGYKLKELIWTDWRSEWEPKPAGPSSIRLILLGRFVEDKTALKDLPFKLDDTNVVHMTVKPADFLEDDETAHKTGGKGHSIRGRDDGERGAGCRCVIL